MKSNDSNETGEPSPNSTSFNGLIIREREPENLEFPFSATEQLSDTDRTVICAEPFSVPTLDIKTWRLKVKVGGESGQS